MFRTRADRLWGLLSLLHNGYRVSYQGRGVNHPPPSSAEVKERVALYLYYSFEPSWPVLGRTLPSLLMLLALMAVLTTANSNNNHSVI